MSEINENTYLIKQVAKQIGFDTCGISKADYLKDDEKHLKDWLKKGLHGEMKYMQNNIEKRTNPTKLFENAKSVISVVLNYYPKQIQDTNSPKIAKYAYGKDYHIVMKDKLHKLLNKIKEHIPEIEGRAYVDTAPVLDKAWAAKSGLGWIGKNTCLINKEIGSFLFIGEIIVDVELEYDEPVSDLCGNCTKCIDACPTKAIIAPRVIDAKKCISYFTIEQRNVSETATKTNTYNWIYGCDICHDVCPYNKNVNPTNVEEFTAKPEILNFTLEDWNALSEKEFNEIFKDSAILRLGYNGFKQNLEMNTSIVCK